MQGLPHQPGRAVITAQGFPVCVRGGRLGGHAGRGLAHAVVHRGHHHGDKRRREPHHPPHHRLSDRQGVPMRVWRA